MNIYLYAYRYNDSQVWWRLRLHWCGIWTIASVSLPLGCFADFSANRQCNHSADVCSVSVATVLAYMRCTDRIGSSIGRYHYMYVYIVDQDQIFLFIVSWFI